MVDLSRLTPQQISMQMQKKKHQDAKDDLAAQQQNIRDRRQTQNGTSHRG